MKNEKDYYVLGIETSCDETSASVVKNGRVVLSNVISSQIDVHKKYGGVVPEIASRAHIEAVGNVVDLAMTDAGLSFDAIDGFAATYGPGLVGALLVGLSYAKALAYAAKKPLIGVHHIEGHICANYIQKENENACFTPPYICLVVSGGHTNLVLARDYGVYDVLGQSRDDAAGEAYDKVARAIGLGYPGGPQIDALAKTGDANAIVFPQAFLEAGSLDFSFSGLKSAVLNYINKVRMTGRDFDRADVAASFQKAVVDVLVAKAMLSCERTGVKRMAMAGGVSSNAALRTALSEACARNGIALHIPEAVYCTDNAAMIASCGYFYLKKGRNDGLSLNAVPNIKLASQVMLD